jgi:hypothetical protein
MEGIIIWEKMVGADGIEPTTSTVSGASRGNAMFPLCFLLSTVVRDFRDWPSLSFPDNFVCFGMPTPHLLHTFSINNPSINNNPTLLSLTNMTWTGLLGAGHDLYEKYGVTVICKIKGYHPFRLFFDLLLIVKGTCSLSKYIESFSSVRFHSARTK